MLNNYTVYHLHSDLSNGVTNIDSITKYDQYVKRASELGMKALAFSEHGSVFEWVKKKETIEKAGMKYIHAEEFYVTSTLEEKIRDNLHCVLIAKNYDGVLELNKLSSAAFNRKDNHFYYVPRISIDELINTSDNIIVTTACLGGILVNGNDEIRKIFIKFIKNNKHRCFLEIQHHIDKSQIDYNKYLYKLSTKYNIPLIAGTDTHALNEEHLEGRKILQKSKNINFPDEEGWDLSFKSYEDLVNAYKAQNSLPMDVVLTAIENTNVMANMIETFELDRSYKYPHLWEDSEKVFMDKIKRGIKRRGVDKYSNRKEYANRIRYELEAYRHNGAIDFMLLMEDIISWCISQDILVGYGRGSVNGSVIAWILGITEMDPIKHKLNFERFMNIERVSLSDIDTDFPPSRIEEVKNYIFNHAGLYCSDIVTFNTIADKGAIRDVGRALNIPLSTVSDICDTVDNEEKYEESREKYQELFKYVDLVKGVIVSIGNHPCGMIVSPHPLDNHIGLCSTSTDSCLISQIYMKEIDGLNYVKLDLLKLDTIELINETCKLANIERCLPDNLDISDIDVWNSIRDDTTGIFQWEGKTGDDYIKKLFSDSTINKFKEIDENIDRMTLFSIGNSAIRPAGASYREDLANGIVKFSGSEAIDEFLKPTFGYLVFQCQIIEFLHSYCGFTMGEADIVRRHFAKKTGTEDDIPVIKDGGYLGNNKNHYIPGFIATMKEKYNMDKEDSEKAIVDFLQVIVDASNYLFSLNHSQPYSYEGYACGWLRYHYPLEFITCSLNLNKDKEEKTIAVTTYAKKMGIKILPPKFRHCSSNYSCDKKQNIIYKGISSIKYLSENMSEILNSFSDINYDSFIDLLVDINNTNIDTRQLDILISLDFFSEFGEINELKKQANLFAALYNSKQLKFDKINKYNLPLWVIQKHANKQTEKTFSSFDSVELLKDICKNIEYEKTSLLDRINYEKECLGYIQLVMPELEDNYYYVTKIEKGRIELYQLNSGEVLKIKVRANTLKDNPADAGDIIKILKIEPEKKWCKNPDGSWGRLEEYEDILKSYKVLH